MGLDEQRLITKSFAGCFLLPWRAVSHHSSLCFRTVMQFVWAVSMQAMTHSVDNVPSQQAVKLVVVGLGFVE